MGLLEKEKFINIPDTDIKIKYSLYSNLLENTNIYSIISEKLGINNSTEYYEECINFTDSLDVANKTFNYLIKNEVLPLTLTPIIDEIITSEIFV